MICTCIKDVIMEDLKKAFSLGKRYEIWRVEYNCYMTIDDTKTEHTVTNENGLEDEWFTEHFKIDN